MLPKSSAELDSTSLTSEYIYMFCLSITGWFITVSFWLRSRAVVQLLNHSRDLHPDVTVSWVWIAKVVVSTLPSLLDGILFSAWNVENILSSVSPFWIIIHTPSFLWLIIVTAVPIMLYSFFAQLVHASLCTNNNNLIQEAESVGGGQPVVLMRIHMRNLELRKLYGDIEQVLSLPLLCSSIITTFTIITSVYYIITGPIKSVYIYTVVIPTLMKVVTIGIMGRAADRVTEEVSHVRVTPKVRVVT